MKVSFRQHDGRDFVDIHTERDGKDVVSRPATDADKASWPEEYAVYLAEKSAASQPVGEASAGESAPAPTTTSKPKRKG
ncbi:hypothetical protein D7X74_30410 [Corallococcus sp. CA047B]|uniref:hypothetical protein n=1 Tax=Corallococcus sp. CA047B TaxID=2316729 RepID=UPI000EA04273|nr:hypothetical protein [Corallococcus sp. CA047B]RKH08998.1 hypothetical protein D7X74_30410 [Corallococcus sp. CA047B]